MLLQVVGSTAYSHDVDGGWTFERRAVIDEAAGVCARCGLAGADTAVRGWGAAELVAAHTRCVVGLGPPAQAYETATDDHDIRIRIWPPHHCFPSLVNFSSLV